MAVWLSPKESNALKKENKCVLCKEEGHVAHECPNWKRKEQPTRRSDKVDKGKKPSTSMGKILDVIGGKEKEEASEPMRAWGKIHEHTANFLSPEMAANLAIWEEEMGPLCKARMAHPDLASPVTPIIGKLCIHVQTYVDKEEIMPLARCDVLLGMPWFHRVDAQIGSQKR